MARKQQPFLWRTLAKIAPKFFDQIVAYGKERPYVNIVHEDGTHYMDRWWLMPKCLIGKDAKGDPYPYKWLPFVIRLHHIRKNDGDRALHDHPANFRTIILKGGYIEETVYGEFEPIEAGQTDSNKAEAFHRIDFVPKEGVWTIFIMGKRRNNWGFLSAGHKVGWQKYLSDNGTMEKRI